MSKGKFRIDGRRGRTVAFYVNKEILDAVDTMADREGRTKSSLVNRLLILGLESLVKKGV